MQVLQARRRGPFPSAWRGRCRAATPASGAARAQPQAAQAALAMRSRCLARNPRQQRPHWQVILQHGRASSARRAGSRTSRKLRLAAHAATIAIRPRQLWLHAACCYRLHVACALRAACFVASLSSTLGWGGHGNQASDHARCLLPQRGQARTASARSMRGIALGLRLTRSCSISALVGDCMRRHMPHVSLRKRT